jgi:hypothetical protein
MILMNKKVLMIAVVILLLLAGGWYYMSSKKTVSPLSQGTGSGEQQSAVTNLRDLIGKGIAQTCTFTSNESKGTVYMNGGKVREDFEITLDKEVMKSHLIVTDNTMYNWSDGQKTGIKMAFDPKATPVAVESPSAGSSGKFDANTNMDYKCSVWLPDSGKFTVPTDVTFTSFAVPSQGSSSSQCSYCDVLTGDDKTQCLKAMNCK